MSRCLSYCCAVGDLCVLSYFQLSYGNLVAIYWANSCSFVSWYKYLIVNLVFSFLGFGDGNLFLNAPFPDRCLLIPFYLFEGSTVKWAGDVIRMPDKRLSKKVIYGELQEGKRWVKLAETAEVAESAGRSSRNSRISCYC